MLLAHAQTGAWSNHLRTSWRNRPGESVQNYTGTFQDFKQLDIQASADCERLALPPLSTGRSGKEGRLEAREPIGRGQPSGKESSRVLNAYRRPRFNRSTRQDCDDSQRTAGAAGNLHGERDHIKILFRKALQVGKVFEDRYVVGEQCDV